LFFKTNTLLAQASIKRALGISRTWVRDRPSPKRYHPPWGAFAEHPV